MELEDEHWFNFRSNIMADKAIKMFLEEKEM